MLGLISFSKPLKKPTFNYMLPVVEAVKVQVPVSDI